jgi:hypothetical protein
VDISKLLAQAAQDAVAAAAHASANGTASAKASPAKAAKRGAKKADAAPKKAAKASEADSELDERLYREVKKQGGRRLEELAVALGIDSKELKFPARRLLDAKRLKKSGKARGTKYRAA